MYEEIIIRALANMNESDAREYIKVLLAGYEKRKSEGKMYDSISLPRVIIMTYYSCIKKPIFSNIIEEFKKMHIPEKELEELREKYVDNENELERVHAVEEQQGLKLVYDYIQQKEDFSDINLYTLSDIHEILYSKAPYPEFGGKYRRDERYLPNSGVEITPPDMIVMEMNLLRDEVNDIVKDGIKLGTETNASEIINYIDRCVELKCKLIKIHPFGDGNGRSIRAFINLLLRLANIPPIYIEDYEKEKYGKAMNIALTTGDYSKIKGFYYYKICDSISSLDIMLEKQEDINNERVKKL